MAGAADGVVAASEVDVASGVVFEFEFQQGMVAGKAGKQVVEAGTHAGGKGEAVHERFVVAQGIQAKFV